VLAAHLGHRQPGFSATIWLSLNLLFLIGSLLSDWAAFSGFGCLLAGGAYGEAYEFMARFNAITLTVGRNRAMS